MNGNEEEEEEVSSSASIKLFVYNSQLIFTRRLRIVASNLYYTNRDTNTKHLMSSSSLQNSHHYTIQTDGFLRLSSVCLSHFKIWSPNRLFFLPEITDIEKNTLFILSLLVYFLNFVSLSSAFPCQSLYFRIECDDDDFEIDEIETLITAAHLPRTN